MTVIRSFDFVAFSIFLVHQSLDKKN